MSERNAVYRIHGEAGALLYIGVTNSVPIRWNGHERVQPWWDELRTLTVEWYATRREAEAAEKAAILAEQPKYNVTYLKSGRGRPGRQNLGPPPVDWESAPFEPQDDDDELLGLDGVGRMLNMYPSTAKAALRHTGGPEGFLLGKYRRFRRGEIRRWIDAVEASQKPRAAPAVTPAEQAPKKRASRQPRAAAGEDALFDRDAVLQVIPGGAA